MKKIKMTDEEVLKHYTSYDRLPLISKPCTEEDQFLHKQDVPQR